MGSFYFKGIMLSIDNSQLQCYISCPRKYYYKYRECLRKLKNEEQEVDLNFGKCFHKALELLYKGKTLEEAKNVFRADFNLIETEKAKTPKNGELLIEGYKNYWSQPVNELSDANLETISVEVTDKFKISDELEWIVKIDRIVKNVSGIWVQEHKTAKKLPYNYFKKFDLSMAISGYSEYVKQKYGQCSGAIINVAVVGYRERPFKGEPAGFHCGFIRDITNRNDAQLLVWREQVVCWAHRLVKDIQTHKEGLGIHAFPMNTDVCWGFKGCPYGQLCLSCDEENIKEVQYEKCNPFEYLENNDN